MEPGSGAATAAGPAQKRGSMKPRRIQLKRTKGWRMPPNTVKVCRPSIWGNPFKVGPDGTRSECVAKYSQHIALLTNAVVQQLRGKNLACWCKPGTPCHADVLLKIANEG